MSSPIITITTNIPMPFMLDADGRSLLESVARLLMRIQQPTLMARAQLEGYTTEEHQVGWRAFVEAAGGNTTVELNVASGVMQSADALVTQRRNSILQQLDGMENTWFPRLRAIIRRVLADDANGRGHAVGAVARDRHLVDRRHAERERGEGLAEDVLPRGAAGPGAIGVDGRPPALAAVPSQAPESTPGPMYL